MEITVDDSEFRALLAEVQVVAGQSIVKSLHVAAGIACRTFGQLTWPKTQSSGESATAKQVNKVFATPERIARDLNLHGGGKNLGSKFLKLMKRGLRERAIDILRDSNLSYKDIPFGPLDPEVHQMSRNNRGRVTRRKPAMGLDKTGKAELRRYRERKKKLVGLTQAGWYKCLRLLGHGNRVKKSKFATALPNIAPGTTSVAFPKWVIRNAGKASGQIDYNLTGPSYYVRIHNATPWAREALHDGAQSFIERAAKERIVNYLKTTLHFARNPRS